MSTACTYEGCTVGETGICALENDLASCSYRIAADAAKAPSLQSKQSETDQIVGAPVLERPAENPSFPSSTTLAPAVINGLMGSRYVRVIGILGDPFSGKTACLVSLYLLASVGKLDGWKFASSRSLMAFEEVSRGARSWNEGEPPEQMTVHTEMADERQPGFLHIRLKRDSDHKCLDFALPDLPGEWTNSLIRSSVTKRLNFLQSADVVWVVVDGVMLLDNVKRQGLISRVGQLAGRLKSMFGQQLPPVFLVATHRDAGEITPGVRQRIHAEVAKHGVQVEVISVAPFSDDAAFPPGYGLAQLLDESFNQTVTAPSFWPQSVSSGQDRSYLRFRGTT